ncbi:MAG: hypothetical protein JWO03_2153 [Bacteroidetes bacterium]|nr:hypothetical protein [Bacteroidota bacterium]
MPEKFERRDGAVSGCVEASRFWFETASGKQPLGHDRI